MEYYVVQKSLRQAVSDCPCLEISEHDNVMIAAASILRQAVLVAITWSRNSSPREEL
jgi:hypothetical protein